MIDKVTLRVRVWIEMANWTMFTLCEVVTLRVRVWIEIGVDKRQTTAYRSHPPCEGVD